MTKFWFRIFPKLLLALWLTAMGAMLLSSCIPNRRILKEIKGQKENFGQILSNLKRIDSTYNTHRIILYRYEKDRIDSSYYNVTDAELLHRIDALTGPKSDRKN